MRGSIVCGVDDSESAKGAARVARELGAQLGLQLVFVHVVEDGPETEEATNGVTTRLRRLTAAAPDVDSGANWRIHAGHPADRLVAAAKDENAALIVVGSNGPRSSLLGSVSADVSRRAPCPVVVVAPGADLSLADRRAGFPGLLEDGYAGGARAARASDDRRGERGSPEFVGGIVRFDLENGTR